MEHIADKGHDPKPAEQVVSGESIREELERILSSRTFHAAGAQRRFLRYAVEQTMAGRGHEVKEYTVGVEVFERGQSFDPRLDNIVRTEARKLRWRVAKYYESEGKYDPVRIEFPSRGYVPTFREADLSNIAAEATETAELEVANLGDREERPAEVPPAEPGAVASAHPLWRWRNAVLLAAVLAIAGVATYAIRLRSSGGIRSGEGASIAVLPFTNLGDSKDESFTDGLTDELINSLGRVQGLHVVSRTSAFQFRGQTRDIREIGEKLNVRTVLEGSVRIYGNRMRINAELDDTANGYSLWSNSYERDFKDALFVQRDLSQAIVAALGAEFARNGSPNQLKFSPNKAVPIDVEAYQDYLRGVYFWNKQTSESVKTAVSYFERAIANDPNYAPAYTGLARCYINMPAFNNTPTQEILPRIQGLATKALQLDSTLAEPHIDLAYAAFLNYDWAAAEGEFKKGLELSPGDAFAHRWYATYLSNVGRLPEALVENETSQQLDPVSTYVLYGTARILYMMRRFDASIAAFDKTLALDPQHGFGHLGLGATYVQKQMYPEAIAESQAAWRQMPDNPSPGAQLAVAYALSGNSPEARKILTKFLDQAARGPFPPKPIADIYIGLGEKDLAFEWLAKAVDARDPYLYLKADPIYDSLRSDPRFAQILDRAHLGSR